MTKKKMKNFLVIGNPIDHSLSPKLHNYWIKKNKLDAFYDKKLLNKSDIDNIILKVKNEEIKQRNLEADLEDAANDIQNPESRTDEDEGHVDSTEIKQDSVTTFLLTKT